MFWSGLLPLFKIMQKPNNSKNSLGEHKSISIVNKQEEELGTMKASLL